VPRLYTAFRASRITAFACDYESGRALEPGDWVRWTDCDTERFHQSGLAETTAVVLGPLDWLPAVHRVHEQIDSGIADGATVLEARAIPEMQGPGTATAAGTIALLVAVAVGRRRGGAPASPRWA